MVIMLDWKPSALGASLAMREDCQTPRSPGVRPVNVTKVSPIVMRASLARLVAVALGFVLCLCSVVPARAQSGVDFTRYVAVGDGFTSGFQDGALHESAQRRAYPALVAAAASVDLVLPVVAEPGF